MARCVICAVVAIQSENAVGKNICLEVTSEGEIEFHGQAITSASLVLTVILRMWLHILPYKLELKRCTYVMRDPICTIRCLLICAQSFKHLKPAWLCICWCYLCYCLTARDWLQVVWLAYILTIACTEISAEVWVHIHAFLLSLFHIPQAYDGTPYVEILDTWVPHRYMCIYSTDKSMPLCCTI